MRKKMLTAFILGLALTLTPASVLASGSTTLLDAVEDTLKSGETTPEEGEEEAPAETEEIPETPETGDPVVADEPAAHDDPLTPGWNTVINGEGEEEAVYAVDKEGEVVSVKGSQTIDGKEYFFDETTGFMKKNALVAVGEGSEKKIFCYGEDGVKVTEDGWVTVDEKSYYLEKGSVLCGNSTKYVQKETNRNIAWMLVGSDWYLVDSDEGYRLSGWQNAGKFEYYLDPANGDIMTTGNKSGWLQLDGVWYNFQSFGAVRNTGWTEINTAWYYFHEDGKMEDREIAELDGKIYAFYDWGGRRSNEMYTTTDGKKYYLTADGSAVTDGWGKDTDGTWYWFNEKGEVTKDDWIFYKSNWYYLDENGQMYAEKWLEYKDNWYYFKSWGGMYANEWALYKGNYYYFESWGGMLHDTWRKIGGYDYCFRSWGGRYQSGKFVIDGEEFVFDANGHKVTAGYYYENGYRYYRMEDGSVCLDLVKVDPNYVKSCGKFITVDRTNGRTTVYGYNSATGKYDTPLKSMYCSVGNPISLTAAGTYNTGWKRLSKEMNASDGSYRCWASYVTQIYGAVYFHGVASDTPDLKSILAQAFNALGTPQSHGCVRLAACDAKWVYQYVRGGTKVQVGNGFALPLAAVRYTWTGNWLDADPTWTPLASGEFVA